MSGLVSTQMLLADERLAAMAHVPTLVSVCHGVFGMRTNAVMVHVPISLNFGPNCAMPSHLGRELDWLLPRQLSSANSRELPVAAINV